LYFFRKNPELFVVDQKKIAINFAGFLDDDEEEMDEVQAT